MIVWPFKPLTEHIETLEWRTDVFRAKSAEQRTALRTAPRRTFNFSHVLTDYELAAARATVRSAQAGDGYLVPDWPQAISVGSVSAGSSVSMGVDPEYQEFGDKALIWESATSWEQVTITLDSAEFFADTVTGNYSNAYVIPLWNGISRDGVTVERIGANLNRAQITLEVTENSDLALSPYPSYRSHDVMTDCPVLVGGLSESIVWPASVFDNGQSIPQQVRQRDIPDYVFAMRWHVFTDADAWELRRWLHSRRGRQKAFWFSSFSKDFEPAASVSGTTLTVYGLPGFTGVGHSGVFDLDIKVSGASYYRRVTTTATGTPVGSRATLDLTLDSTLTANLSDIQRVSFLRCARFDADRIELLHAAQGGTRAQVPCREIEEP